MQGKQEQECLNRAKELMTQNGDLRLLKYFQAAVPNAEASKFPDFLFDGGFIEHFKVYTSKENRNGAEHERAEREFDKEYKADFERRTSEWLQTQPIAQTMGINRYEMVSPEYGYEHFVKSFKRNFDSHIKSLNKFNGEKFNGIFLIEAEGGRILVLENGVFKSFYCLKYDKDILEYLYQFASALRYVVFLQNESYEILELSDIPHVLAGVPKKVSFGVGRYKNIHLGLFIDV